jgi:acetyl-CoA synthetase
MRPDDDLRPHDVHRCNADSGWATGTSYGIIGGSRLGFKAERWYDFIAKHEISVWYPAPAAIRLLRKPLRSGADRVEPIALLSEYIKNLLFSWGISLGVGV